MRRNCDQAPLANRCEVCERSGGHPEDERRREAGRNMDARWTSYDRFRRMMSAARPMNEEGHGGSHTDLFRFDEPSLREALTAEGEGTVERPRASKVAQSLSHDYFVKKGKVQFFSQPLLGSENNDIRRPLISYAFGPVGYNFMPSLEKTLLDATEAVRLVPYLGFGPASRWVAPDFVSVLEHGGRVGGQESIREGALLRVLDDGADLRETVYGLLADDPYFHSRVTGLGDLQDFQAFARKNPISPQMEEKLAEFFEGPITVGVRDTLRWAAGSRHPRMDWAQARSTIDSCYERFGDENFLLPEFNYYTWDADYSVRELRALYASNRRVAARFADRIAHALPAPILHLFQAADPVRIAFQLLDFHYDYPLYDVEPYTGFLSTTAARMLARTAVALFLQATDRPDPADRNHDLSRLPRFHGSAHAFFGSLDDSARERVLDLLAKELVSHELESRGNALGFERIPRTFYTFQRRADAPFEGKTVRRVLTIHDLWREENRPLLARYPELSEKLVVFFTQIYRHFEDTSFVADLRPRDSGRDIFLYGIWGYSTENLLLMETEDSAGRSTMDVRFVDNRDQFKQYRRTEDRRQPLGLAKYALRLVHPIVEPAFQRSVGIFVDHVHRGGLEAHSEPVEEPAHSLAQSIEHGLDFTQKVVKDALGQTATHTMAAIDDLVDDVYAGAKAIVRSTHRAARRLRRGDGS